MSEQLDYRSYDNFNFNAIQGNNGPSPEGWKEDAVGGTPIDSDNLNAMLNMLIYIRNVIGKTGDFTTPIDDSLSVTSTGDDDKNIANYINTLIQTIKNYTDSTAAQTLTNASIYTDTKAADTLTNARNYTNDMTRGYSYDRTSGDIDIQGNAINLDCRASHGIYINSDETSLYSPDIFIKTGTLGDDTTGSIVMNEVLQVDHEGAYILKGYDAETQTAEERLAIATQKYADSTTSQALADAKIYTNNATEGYIVTDATNGRPGYRQDVTIKGAVIILDSKDNKVKLTEDSFTYNDEVIATENYVDGKFDDYGITEDDAGATLIQGVKFKDNQVSVRNGAMFYPLVTKQWVESQKYLTEHQSLADYALKSEIPTIPAKVSAFENDKGYLTQHQDISGKANKVHTHKLADISDYKAPDLSGYALKSEIPTNYLTEIPAEYITETELAAEGFLKEHQSLDNYYTKAEVNALIPDVSEFISEIPSEYVTEIELEQKGYLTEHQSLENYATKKYVDDAVKNVEVDLTGYATEDYVDSAAAQTLTDAETYTDNKTAGYEVSEGIITINGATRFQNGSIYQRAGGATWYEYATKNWVNNAIADAGISLAVDFIDCGNAFGFDEEAKS